MDFEFRPRPVITALALLIAMVFVALATWQLSRFLEKSELEDEWNRRQAEPPKALTSLDGFDPEALDYRRVEAFGDLDETRTAIFDNHRFRAEPGCLVAQPLSLRDGGTMVVIRGFVPHTPDRRCTDVPITPAGSGSWHALVHTVRPNLADVPHRDQRGPALVWDTLDVDGTYASWGIADRPASATVLVLDQVHVGDPFPSASFEHVSAPYLTSMRHLNYAGTWMILLLVTMGFWGALSMRRVDPA